ncbi:MAG: HIT family protein [Acidobacteria bacterium]|nr:HIT family protein [Acidobacteriota bacterium]
MSAWRDPERWRGLVDGTHCPICLRGKPLNVIRELEASWLTMSEEAPMRGYVCLVARTHVIELHELPEPDAFMRDMRTVSQAVMKATGAIKLNYEIHGNTLPHLHVHFFPRYVGDAFEGRPIDPKSVLGPVYEAGEFVKLRERIVELVGA